MYGPMRSGVVQEAQLQRQLLWLKESWLWQLDHWVIAPRDQGKARLTALDLGCGPGLVMELLASRFAVKGLDIDRDLVKHCQARGLDVIQGDAAHLPFASGSFDIAYCSFLLLWMTEPKKVMAEMERVSRQWVICLAEPDYGARIDHPAELEVLKQRAIEGLEREGADPLIGRKLRSLFSACGLEAEIGVHPGVWGLERLRQEGEEEVRAIENALGPAMDGAEKKQLKATWERACRQGSLFQFNPIFYAFAQKRVP